MRRSAFAIAAVGATALVVTAASLAGEAPPELEVKSHGRTLKATGGSYCHVNGSTGLCADAAYPLPLEGRVPAHAGGKIALSFDTTLDQVSAVLRDAQSRQLAVLEVSGEGREFLARLPEHVPAATDRLGVFVRHPQGDRDFEAGLELHPHFRPPRRIRLESHDREITPARTGTCRPPEPDEPFCAVPDVFRPTRPLPVHARGLVRLSSSVPLQKVEVDLSPCGPARRLERQSARSWTFLMPRGWPSRRGDRCEYASLNVHYGPGREWRGWGTVHTFNLREHDHGD